MKSHVEGIEELQRKFKTNTVMRIENLVLNHALSRQPPGWPPGWPFWPDEIDLSSIDAGSRTCVGPVYSGLCKRGVLKRSGEWRKTKRHGNGAIVFSYLLLDADKARAIISENQRSIQSGSQDQPDSSPEPSSHHQTEPSQASSTHTHTERPATVCTAAEPCCKQDTSNIAQAEFSLFSGNASAKTAGGKEWPTSPAACSQAA